MELLQFVHLREIPSVALCRACKLLYMCKLIMESTTEQRKSGRKRQVPARFLTESDAPTTSKLTTRRPTAEKKSKTRKVMLPLTLTEPDSESDAPTTSTTSKPTTEKKSQTKKVMLPHHHHKIMACDCRARNIGFVIRPFLSTRRLAAIVVCTCEQPWARGAGRASG